MCSEVNAVFFPFSDAWPFLFLWWIFSWPSGNVIPCNNTNREFNCQGSVSRLRAVHLGVHKRASVEWRDARNQVPLPSRAFNHALGHLHVSCILLHGLRI